MVLGSKRSCWGCSAERGAAGRSQAAAGGGPEPEPGGRGGGSACAAQTNPRTRNLRRSYWPRSQRRLDSSPPPLCPAKSSSGAGAGDGDTATRGHDVTRCGGDTGTRCGWRGCTGRDRRGAGRRGAAGQDAAGTGPGRAGPGLLCRPVPRLGSAGPGLEGSPARPPPGGGSGVRSRGRAHGPGSDPRTSVPPAPGSRLRERLEELLFLCPKAADKANGRFSGETRKEPPSRIPALRPWMCQTGGKRLDGCGGAAPRPLRGLVNVIFSSRGGRIPG